MEIWSRPVLEVHGGASRVVFFVFALAAGLFGVVVVAALPSEEMRPVAAILAGIPALICLGGALLVRARARGRTLGVHAEGVSERSGKGTTQLRFAEVEEVRVSVRQLYAAQVQGAGLLGAVAHAAVVGASAAGRHPALPYDATSLTVTLKGAGREIALRKWDARWLDAYAAIRSQVEPRLLEAARAAVRRGGTASFGNVQVSAQGVSCGGKPPVAFADIERFDVSWVGVVVKQRGKLLAAGSVRLAKVANVHVLIDLVAELRAAASQPAPVQAWAS